MFREALAVFIVIVSMFSTAQAEKVGKEDTLWFTFDTSSFFYEENYATVSLGKEIPVNFGRNMAHGPSLLTRDGNLGYSQLLKNPKVDVVQSPTTFTVVYEYPRARCGDSRFGGPNCRIKFKFVVPLESSKVVTAPFDPAQTVTEVSGRTPSATGQDVLTATSTCLKGKRCKRTRNYILEPAGWRANILYINR